MNNLIADVIEDLDKSNNIELYHQHYEATINVRELENEYLLKALHENGFDIIHETDNILTIRFDSANPEKPNEITPDKKFILDTVIAGD